jgi:hypothetical protein
MNNQLRQEKLTRFVNDEAMSRAVYETLLSKFLNDNIIQEVNVLAASRLSIKFLNDAWKEFEHYKIVRTDDKEINNIGM